MKNIILLLFLITSFYLQATEKAHISLNYMFTGIKEVEIQINSFPFKVYKDISDNISFSGRINPYVKKGGNIITFLFNNNFLSYDKDKNKIIEKSLDYNYFQLKISEQILSKNENVLLDFETKKNSPFTSLVNDKNKIIQNDSYTQINIPFYIENFPVKEYPWDEEINKNEIKKEEIVKILFELREGFDNKNINKIKNILEIKNKILAESMFINKEKMESMQLNFFTRIFKDKKYKLQEIDKKNISLQFYNNKNLVKILDNNKQPIIINLNGSKFKIDIYMSLINNKWTIVR